jgi:hypothetical protein
MKQEMVEKMLNKQQSMDKKPREKGKWVASHTSQFGLRIASWAYRSLKKPKGGELGRK